MQRFNGVLHKLRNPVMFILKVENILRWLIFRAPKNGGGGSISVPHSRKGANFYEFKIFLGFLERKTKQIETKLTNQNKRQKKTKQTKEKNTKNKNKNKKTKKKQKKKAKTKKQTKKQKTKTKTKTKKQTNKQTNIKQKQKKLTKPPPGHPCLSIFVLTSYSN